MTAHDSLIEGHEAQALHGLNAFPAATAFNCGVPNCRKAHSTYESADRCQREAKATRPPVGQARHRPLEVSPG